MKISVITKDFIKHVSVAQAMGYTSHGRELSPENICMHFIHRHACIPALIYYNMLHIFFIEIKTMNQERILLLLRMDSLKNNIMNLSN